MNRVRMNSKYYNNFKEKFCMKIQMSETNGKTSIDVKFENEELQWAQNKPETFDKFVNNLKEMYISNIELAKTKNNNFITSLQKGIETVNNISNNLYNYYINQNGEDIPDLPYK